MVACTTISTTHTIVGIVDGFTLPLVIFYALAFAFSYFVFTTEFEAPPSSTLFFLLITLYVEFVIAFFLFSSLVCISSLVILTLVGGFYGFSFRCTNKY